MKAYDWRQSSDWEPTTEIARIAASWAAAHGQIVITAITEGRDGLAIGNPLAEQVMRRALRRACEWAVRAWDEQAAADFIRGGSTR